MDKGALRWVYEGEEPVIRLEGLLNTKMWRSLYLWWGITNTLPAFILPVKLIPFSQRTVWRYLAPEPCVSIGKWVFTVHVHNSVFCAPAVIHSTYLFSLQIWMSFLILSWILQPLPCSLMPLTYLLSTFTFISWNLLPTTHFTSSLWRLMPVQLLC